MTPVDAVTQQIIANALAAVADEMAVTIFRTAHSTVVRDSMDFSASLCDAHGNQVAQAVTVPFHLGAVPVAIDSLIATYGDDLHDGDIYILNDPFDGGMHIPDVFVFRPIFAEDHLVGFACTTAHHADLGGRLPGSAATDNTEIFQEGLRLPWVRLFSAGEPVREVFEIIRANVRIPRMTIGDISAQIAACAIGSRGLTDLVSRYGRAQLADTMSSLLDYTERLVRDEIRAWPDGEVTFVDHIDSDGIDVAEVPIVVTLTVRDDEVIADFAGSAPMVRGALNCTHSVTAASVYLAIRSALIQDVPTNAGAFRPIQVLTEPGTITNVSMPGASSMRGVTGFRIVDAVNGALAQLVPDRVPAAGEGGNTLAIFGGMDDAGARFIFYELVCGTWGATSSGDGNDGLSNPASTAANIPVEVAEAEFPVLIERYGLVQDSGGAGRFRGGLAVERAWKLLAPEASLIVRSDRQIHRPYGLEGGGQGAASENVVLAADEPDVRVFGPMFTTTLAEDETYYHRTAGGGGWGDPLDRDPKAVAFDVAEGKVSSAAALDTYGVALETDGAVSASTTEAVRSQMRAQSQMRAHPADAGSAAVTAASRSIAAAGQRRAPD